MAFSQAIAHDKALSSYFATEGQKLQGRGAAYGGATSAAAFNGFISAVVAECAVARVRGPLLRALGMQFPLARPLASSESTILSCQVDEFLRDKVREVAEASRIQQQPPALDASAAGGGESAAPDPSAVLGAPADHSGPLTKLDGPAKRAVACILRGTGERTVSLEAGLLRYQRSLGGPFSVDLADCVVVFDSEAFRELEDSLPAVALPEVFFDCAEAAEPEAEAEPDLADPQEESSERPPPGDSTLVLHLHPLRRTLTKRLFRSPQLETEVADAPLLSFRAPNAEAACAWLLAMQEHVFFARRRRFRLLDRDTHLDSEQSFVNRWKP